MADSRASIAEEARLIRKAVLERHGYSREEFDPGGGEKRAIDDAATLATVSSHWGVTSSIPVIGPVVVLIRRAIRIALRWYINPIVEQQNAFNDAVVRALLELQFENEKLRSMDLDDNQQVDRA
jgi:hypothetical protein